MWHTLFRSLSLTGTLLLAPVCISGQGSEQLLANARDQIRARNLDSAIVLLHAITASKQADSAEDAEAFVWLGVATFYKAGDSTASEAFRRALDYNPLLTPAPVLARLDSGLAVLWEHEQTMVLCGEPLPAWLWSSDPSRPRDAVNSDARALQGPEIISAPALQYPDHLRRAEIQGRVVVRAVIDTSGRAEKASIKIISATHRDFNPWVRDYTERARFSVPVSNARHVRSCVVFPVDFKIHR